MCSMNLSATRKKKRAVRYFMTVNKKVNADSWMSILMFNQLSHRMVVANFRGYLSFCIKASAFAAASFVRAAVPLEISAFSVRPPHRDRVTSGRSLAESERHSVPLSAAALPTDCGDWEPDCIPESIQCLVAASDSLGKQKRTPLHSSLRAFHCVCVFK